MNSKTKLSASTTKPKRSSLSKAAQQLGRKGGKSKSAAKVIAARINGKKGGRPPKEKREH